MSDPNLPPEAATDKPKFPLAEQAGMAFMRGTEGILAFLILLTRGPLALGVRPLFHTVYVPGAEGPRAFAGFRIRVCRKPESENEQTNLPASGISAGVIQEAFPSMAFDKLNDTRGSIVVGAGFTDRLEHVLQDPDAFAQRLVDEGFYTQVVGYLREKAFGDIAFNADVLAALLREQIESVLPRVAPKDDPIPVAVDTQAAAIEALAKALKPNVFEGPAEAATGLTGGPVETPDSEAAPIEG